MEFCTLLDSKKNAPREISELSYCVIIRRETRQNFFLILSHLPQSFPRETNTRQYLKEYSS